jgi:hypothetical protein
MEPPIEHHDVTTIMALLGDTSATSLGSVACWRRRRMGKKRRLPKMTREEIAERELHQQWVRERIAYHEAKAREEGASRRNERR